MGRNVIVAAKQALTDARATATAEEQRFLDRVAKLLDDMSAMSIVLESDAPFEEQQQRFRPMMDRFVLGYAAVLRDMAALEHDDLDVQADVAAKLFQMPFTAQYGTPDAARDEAFRREGIARADTLVANHPSSARVHELRAYMCLFESIGKDAAGTCMPYYARCMALGSAGCKEQYGDLARAATTERCGASDFRPNLRIATASNFERPGTHPMPGPEDGRPVHVYMPSATSLAKIATGARAITFRTRTQTGADESGAAVWSPSREQDAVALGLAPDRGAPFDTWLANSAEPHISTWIVLLDGDRPIAWGRAPLRGHPPVPDDTPTFNGIAASLICKKTVRPSLPAGLPLP